jgi:hypothetical protein
LLMWRGQWIETRICRCFGSLARNGLGVTIGVLCGAALVCGLGRACAMPPSVTHEVWWLWLAPRMFNLGVGINILLTCPLIALGDEHFRNSLDAQTFMLAGVVYFVVGLVGTHEMRDRADVAMRAVCASDAKRATTGAGE